MKYLKIYEEFAKPDVSDYDWEYFFQELIDNHEIRVVPNTIEKFERVFKFSLMLDKIHIKNFKYTTKYSSFAKNFSELKSVEGSIKHLIELVESLGGEIIIEPSIAHTNILFVYIDKFVFSKIM